MTSRDQELHWVLLAQCHDRDALEQLLRSVQGPLTRYLRGLVGPTDADDLAQDVLVVVSRRLGWLEHAALFRPWLFRIASRAAMKHLRRHRRRTAGFQDDEVLEQSPAPAAEPIDSGQVMAALMASDCLSPASRAVLELHFEEEMTLAEVAAILEIPVGTVKSRLAYGLAALRRHIEHTRRDP